MKKPLLLLSALFFVPCTSASKYKPTKIGLTIQGSHTPDKQNVRVISPKEFEERTSHPQLRQRSKSFHWACPLNLRTASYEEEFPPISPNSKTPSPTKWGKSSETPKSPEVDSRKFFPEYFEQTKPNTPIDRTALLKRIDALRRESSRLTHDDSDAEQ
jgi:hypothetical protein